MWTKDLPNNVKIAVAVSGGADSVALLDGLVCVAAEKGLGAEGQFCAKLFLAMRKTSVLLSQKCGELSKTRNNTAIVWFLWAGVRSLAHSCLSN